MKALAISLHMGILLLRQVVDLCMHGHIYYIRMTVFCIKYISSNFAQLTLNWHPFSLKSQSLVSYLHTFCR